MQSRTAWGEWVGFLQIGDDPSNRSQARLSFAFDEPAGLLRATIFVPGQPEYDLVGLTVSVTPGNDASSGTPWGPGTLRTDAVRNGETILPDRVVVSGPMRPDSVRLVVSAVDGGNNPVFSGVYEFS